MTPTTANSETLYRDRLAAMLLVDKVATQAWFACGMKRFRGQARLKRIVEYLCQTVGE